MSSATQRWSSIQATKQDKETNDVQIQKEELKLSLFVDYMIDFLCRNSQGILKEKPPRTQKWVQQKCKIQNKKIQKLVYFYVLFLFLYTSKEYRDTKL